MFLTVQLLALYFSPCILSPPLLVHTVPHTFHLLITYNYRYLLLLTKYLSYFILCNHVYVMSKLGQLRTYLNLMTTRHNSCLSLQKKIIISITYPLKSLLGILKFLLVLSVKNLGITLECHLTMNESDVSVGHPSSTRQIHLWRVLDFQLGSPPDG